MTGGFDISRNVSRSGSTWTYVYSVDVVNPPGQTKDVSNFILEVTLDNQPPSILGGTSTPREGPTLFDKSGNAAFPNGSTIFGVEFDFGGAQPP